MIKPRRFLLFFMFSNFKGVSKENSENQRNLGSGWGTGRARGAEQGAEKAVGAGPAVHTVKAVRVGADLPG